MAPFRLGITTDVQYAAKPPMVHPHPPPAAAAAAAAGTRPPLIRDYAAALPRLAAALGALRGGAGVDVVVHLGDLIDGHEGDVTASTVDLDAVLTVFDEACGGERGADGGGAGTDRPIPVLHAVGNHCLTAGRAAVMGSRAFWGEEAVGEGVAASVAAAGGSLRWGDDVLPAAPAGATTTAAVNGCAPPPSPSPPHVGYYEFTPPGNTGWRLLFLDTMHLSVAYPAGDARRAAGEAALSAAAATGATCAKEWNGAVGEEQRRWLEQRLSAAAADGVQVLVCGHHPLVREAASSRHLAWDGDAVAEALDRHAGVVRAYFCGHFHPGGYTVRESGVHHLTFTAILDALTPDGEPSNAWAVVTLGDNAIDVEGAGEERSRRLCWETMTLSTTADCTSGPAVVSSAVGDCPANS
ncbi:hypothetical protein MMPV_000510 [Pyropia vietnamensis]